MANGTLFACHKSAEALNIMPRLYVSV